MHMLLLDLILASFCVVALDHNIASKTKYSVTAWLYSIAAFAFPLLKGVMALNNNERAFVCAFYSQK